MNDKTLTIDGDSLSGVKIRKPKNASDIATIVISSSNSKSPKIEKMEGREGKIIFAINDNVEFNLNQL